MQRLRGYWWAPDGSRLAVAHVDERDVLVWHIADPTDPAAPPRAVHYPQAGTNDAAVTLWVFDAQGAESGERVEVRWDHERFPYLSRVHWDHGPLTLLVQTRDQKTVQLLEASETTGETTPIEERSDPQWVDLTQEAPIRLLDGRLVDVVADREADTYRLTISGEAVTPAGLQVRQGLSAREGVLLRGSDGDPTEIHLWRWTDGGGAVRLTEEPGIHSGAEGGDVTVRISATPHDMRSAAFVWGGGEEVAAIENVSEPSVIEARPRFLTLGERELRAALLLPGGGEP